MFCKDENGRATILVPSVIKYRNWIGSEISHSAFKTPHVESRKLQDFIVWV